MIPINGSSIKCLIPVWSELIHDSRIKLPSVALSAWCSQLSALLPTPGKVLISKRMPPEELPKQVAGISPKSYTIRVDQK